MLLEMLGLSALAFGIVAPMVTDLLKKEQIVLEDEILFDCERLKSFFRNIELQNKDEIVPCIISYETNSNLIRFKIKLCDGVSKSDLEKKKEYFLIYFKAIDIKFIYDIEKNVDVEIIRCVFKEKYDFKFTSLKEPREVIVGYDVLGNFVQADIYKHLLVSGMTGFGKTVFLQTVLLNALYNFKNLELDIFDFKGTDFVYFSELKNTKSFVCSVTDALSRLKELEQEMDHRYLEFQKYKVSNLEDYNNISKSKMNYKYILIDEIATLTASKEGKECYKILSRLTSKCRASGMFCLIGTQRPDATNLPSDIKANIGTIVGFKCNNKYSSEVVCNKSCLEFLEKEGEGILFGVKEQNFKSMFLDSEKVKRHISNLK